MTQTRTALLPDRGVVRVSGEDAEKLLQGIVTGDMALLGGRRAIHAALLTPQGKILFEFFVVRSGDAFLLETARDQAAALVKRLTLYKLRAKVDIRDMQDGWRVSAAWGGPVQDRGDASHVAFPDPRLPELGMRVLAEGGTAGGGTDADAQDYHAHRIGLGVPEGGKDYAFGDTFPHDANFDLLEGVSFGKGCFVGQEVVSRMQHRGSARKRVVIIESNEPLRGGSAVMAGQATIGTLGSVAGCRALALVRLDRAEEAERKGEPLTVAGAAIAIRRPAYMKPAALAGAQ
jgi:folate-binding protein YgfZ